jgi:hypothetical protein
LDAAKAAGAESAEAAAMAASAAAVAAAAAVARFPARNTEHAPDPLPIQHVLALGFSQLAFTLIRPILQKMT